MATTVLSKALKTDINKPPVVSDPVPDLMKKQQEAVQEELSAGEKLSDLEIKKAESEAKRTAELEKTRVADTAALTARQEEREKPIREQKKIVDDSLMNAHFEPSQENFRDQAALFSLINVIGFAIGRGGKQNAQQAMSAMNGMLEGHQQGRADVFKEESVRFDKNFKALQQKAVFLENELRHSLEEFTRDKKAADERATAAFAQAGADFMKVYAEKKGLTAAYERAKEIRKSIDKAIEGERLRKERIEDKANADRQHRELVLATRVPGETPQEKREAKMGTAGPQYTIYQKTGKMLPDERTAKEVQANVQGIRIIEDLQKDLSDPEIKAGVFSKASPILEKIKSIFNSGPVEYETAVNQQLTGTDKTTLFLKKALLSSYAIERAAKNGQRLTVQDMKTVGPVLDPTNYTAITYAELLDQRRRDLYGVMEDYGFNDSDVKKLSKTSEYKPYAGEQIPTITSQEQYNALQPGAYYVEDGVRYQKPRGK